MHNNKKNEELQSRREFFKKAAKGALPILSAVVLAGAPSILSAAEGSPMSCSYDGCSYTCATSCARYCRGTCNQVCMNSCYKSCNGGSK